MVFDTEKKDDAGQPVHEFELRCWDQSEWRYLRLRLYQVWVRLSDPVVTPLSVRLYRRHRRAHGQECMCIPWHVRRDLKEFEMNGYGADDVWLPIDAQQAALLGWGES